MKLALETLKAHGGMVPGTTASKAAEDRQSRYDDFDAEASRLGKDSSVGF